MAAILERIVPGNTLEPVFIDHEERYQFAGQFVPGKRVLDAASGPGIGTDYLIQCGASECIGIDIDRESINRASAMYHQPTFTTASILSMPFPDHSFDVVVSMETIEHIREQEDFIKECRRVLRPNGVLVCSTPNHRVSSWLYRDPNPYHLREFSAEEFSELLRKQFVSVDLFSQRPKFRYWEILKQVTAVPILRKLGLLEMVLNAMGQNQTRIETSIRFRAGMPDFPRYTIGAIWEPTIVIAVCHN